MTVICAEDGFKFWPGRLEPAEQRALLQDILVALNDAPLYQCVTPGGRRMSVEMSNLGDAGWVSDATGYRYQDRHPVTGAPWPPIPDRLLDLWVDLCGDGVLPDACLVNLYRGKARMSLHQDRDEAVLTHPVLSVSLGDAAVFRIGGTTRGGPTRSVKLSSGDVCMLAGEARLAFHGVDRILAGSSQLVPGGGRLNLTMRRARP